MSCCWSWIIAPICSTSATVKRMLGYFQTALLGIVANSQQRVVELPILSEAERHQLLLTWNDTDTEWPSPLELGGIKGGASHSQVA